ncbi:hypothetical protein V6N11_001530 [Hibiscus sabdariffa]|uniref:Uncharacterized protein n=1 Tax=Hibiscus sabdariffa TaxID=183260 RepID=A0ABR2S0T7_9ROSI
MDKGSKFFMKEDYSYVAYAQKVLSKAQWDLWEIKSVVNRFEGKNQEYQSSTVFDYSARVHLHQERLLRLIQGSKLTAKAMDLGDGAEVLVVSIVEVMDLGVTRLRIIAAVVLARSELVIRSVF